MLSTNTVHQSKGQYLNFTWNHFPWYQLLYAAYSCSPLDLTSFCKNTFADMVGPLSCDIYQALVVDILHEFELGVFKSVFRHLLRLLHAINPVGMTNLIAVLNARYVCFHLSGLPTRSLLNIQVPSNPILQERCHLPLSTQCLWSLSVCRTTFRRCITGNYISHHKISLVNTSVCLSVQSLHVKDYFLPSTTRLCANASVPTRPVACPCKAASPHRTFT